MTKIATEMDTREIKYLGCWNVRTMFETSKAQQIAKEMKKYKIEILGLNETRWTGCDKVKIDAETTVIYSGSTEQNAKHEYGVGFMLSTEARKSLIEWEGITNRIITARFKTRFRNLTIINVYAPTNEKEQEQKEDFYEQLQTTYEKIQTDNPRDIVILMGDINAKIGKENKGIESVMGKEASGEMNENGKLFTNFCAFNGFVIGGSMFPHKEIHKMTWISPDKATRNQIDHIAITRKWRHSLLDVRAMRGADVASDHILLRAKFKIKLMTSDTFRKCTEKSYNIRWLKEDEEIHRKYKRALKNEVDKHMEQKNNTNIEDSWNTYKEIYKSTAKETLGYRRRTDKQWLTKETWDTIQERRIIKRNILATNDQQKKALLEVQYTEKNKEVKKGARRDKRNYTESILNKGEKAANQNDLRTLYECTRQLTGQRTRLGTHQLKSKDGKKLKTEREMQERWIEYFSEMFKNKQTEGEINEIEGIRLEEIDETKFREEEVKCAIQNLKDGKSPGPDGIVGELLKMGEETSIQITTELINKIWEREKVPEEWTQGIIVTLPKKGDKSRCENWRAITLLCTTSKILTRLILNRLKEGLDRVLRQNQAGFRANKSCTDQIATLRIVIEQTVEWQNKLYVNFIDFERAFDSIDRQKMWNIIESYGIPQKYIRIIKELYRDSSARVKWNGTLTDKITVESGVRQGCILSPTLFLILIDWIMKKATNKTGIHWSLCNQLEDLDFADDVCLLSEKRQHMQKKLDKLIKEARKIGLEINNKKTKIMKINTPREMGIKIKENEIEEVKEFTYLGSIINIEGGTEADIEARIGKAQNAFRNLNKIWSSKELTLSTKLRIFNTNVKSILLYGAETWKVNRKDTTKLQTFINKCLRKIKRIFWPNRITNLQLWSDTNQEPIGKTICRRKWKWVGHTLRKKDNNITRQALDYKPVGKRKQGRPVNTWKRSNEKDLEKIGKTWTEIKPVATDRQKWRETVDALCSTWSEED